MFKANLVQILMYILIISLGLYVMIAMLLYLFQSSLIYFPDPELIATPHEIGLAYEATDFKTEDGVALSGWFIPGSSSRVLLFCHGNAGNISHRLESIQIFNRLGLSTFIFDYRGYGESKGKTTELGTYYDAQGAWSYLVQEKGYSPANIIIFGRSLGGAVAAHLAMNVKPAALILESSFSSAPDLGAGLYPIFPVRLLSRFKYATADYVRGVSCPVLVVHSRDDDIVPSDLGFKVYRSANEPKELLEIRGDHNSGFLVSGELYLAGLKSFIEKYVNEANAF